MNSTILPEKTVKRILEFWFGDLKGREIPEARYRKRWWIKDPATDRLIKEMFQDVLEDVKSRYSEDIELSPRDSLAAVILLDQFSRNIYRDMPKAFSGDDIALFIVLRGIRLGSDQGLKAMERIFYYMPLMHSEDPEVQKVSVEQFKKLEDEFSEPPKLKDMLRGSRIYAEKHAEIISRFERYPHRNEILGRKSTEKEIDFLKGPGSSF